MLWMLGMEQAWAQSPKVVVNTGMFEAIWAGSFLVQLTLLILLGLSIVCWAVAYMKFKQLKELHRANVPFFEKFWKATSLDHLFENLAEYEGSNLARVFKAGYMELQRLAESPLVKKTGGEGSVKLAGLDNLERALKKGIDNEIHLLESRLNILATTGSTGPFIGLFGTVWGIMSAFQKIGATGSASLAVVAPGISEALLTTAVGLVAAIPGVVLYNHFIAKLRREEIDLNNFATDFLNIVKRNFFKDE